MAFIVVNGSTRKQFDTIREALEYRTMESTIYDMDAFGNVKPMNDEMIQEQLKYEPVVKPVQAEPAAPAQPPQQPQPAGEKPITVTVNLSQPKPQEPAKEAPKSSGMGTMIKYFLYALMIIVLLAVVFWILSPYMNELRMLLKPEESGLL